MKRILSPPPPTMIVPGAAHDGARDDLDDRVRLIMGCAGSKSAPSPRATRARYEALPGAPQRTILRALDACAAPTDAARAAALSAALRAVEAERAVDVFARSKEEATASTSGVLEPVKADCEIVPGSDDAERWRALGTSVAREGKLAVVLLAGGQGTRLGSSNPKGMYDIGLPSGKSLFELQGARLAKLGELAGAKPPVWYLSLIHI